MFCNKCGNILPDSAKFCNSCGAPVERGTQVNAECDHPHDVFEEFESPRSYENTAYSAPQPDATAYEVVSNNGLSSPVPQVRFGDAIRLYFQRYIDFSGRSRRSEFWFAMLFVGLVGGALSSIFGSDNFIYDLWRLATLLPTIAICVRRLHDAGKPGTFYLWILLPIIGWIMLLVQFTRDSDPSNQWGPNPKLR